MESPQLKTMEEMWNLVSLQIAFPLIIVVVSYLLFNLRSRAKGDNGRSVVPGHTGLPIVGETLALYSCMKSPLGLQSFAESRVKRYGTTFLTNILGRNRVFTSDREAAKIVLSSEHTLFRFSGGKAAENMLGSNSVFYAGADIHKKIRRVVGDPLSRDNLKKNFETMEAICLEILDWWSGKTVSAMDGTSSFAFQIISHITASIRKGPELSRLHKSFSDIIAAMGKFPIKLPGTTYYKGFKAREKLMVLLDTLIDRRRKGEEMKDDFIQSMISRDGLSQEERLTDAEIKDNCLAFLLAGHATTGATLMWAMKYLEENQEAKEKLMEEYKSIQEKKAGSNVTRLTWDDLNHMPYTSNVILETLRMANPAQWTSRLVLQDTILQRYDIKKDWLVTIEHVGLHYDPSLYPNPKKFDPSRFVEKPKPYSFIGFGAGMRTCLGINLAKLEISIFLYHLCTKYRWRSLNEDNSLSSTLVRSLKNGYLIQVEPQ